MFAIEDAIESKLTVCEVEFPKRPKSFNRQPQAYAFLAPLTRQRVRLRLTVKRNAIRKWLPNLLGHIFLPVNRKLDSSSNPDHSAESRETVPQ
jgi:hypothetical protein